MTNNNDLQRKIRLILGQYKPTGSYYPPLSAGTSVTNEQALLLKTLRGQGGHSEDDFVKILSKEVNDSNAPVVVHTLVELGRLDAVLAILGKAGRSNLNLSGSIWGALGEKLGREPHRFTDADLEEIDKIRGMEEQTLRLEQKRRLSEGLSF